MKNSLLKYFLAPIKHGTNGKHGKYALLLSATLLVVLHTASADTTTPARKTIYAVVYGNQKYFVGSSTQRSGLYVSSDTARTWKHLGTDNVKAYSMDAVDSSHGRILFLAAGNGVHRSTDYGATWRIVTDWRITEVLDVKVDQLHPQLVLAATAFGLWRSTDVGESWGSVAGDLSNVFVYRIGGANDTILLAFGEGSICKYANQQSSCSYPRLYGVVHSRASFGSVVWIGTSFRPYCVMPAIVEFDTVTTVVIRDKLKMSVYDMYNYLDSILYVVGENGISMMSRSYMDNWEADANLRTDGFVDITSNLSIKTIHSIVGFGRTVFVGTFGDGIYRREGNKWIPSGLEGSQIWRLVVKDY